MFERQLRELAAEFNGLDYTSDKENVSQTSNINNTNASNIQNEQKCQLQPIAESPEGSTVDHVAQGGEEDQLDEYGRKLDGESTDAVISRQSDSKEGNRRPSGPRDQLSCNNNGDICADVQERIYNK